MLGSEALRPSYTRYHEEKTGDVLRGYPTVFFTDILKTVYGVGAGVFLHNIVKPHSLPVSTSVFQLVARYRIAAVYIGGHWSMGKDVAKLGTDHQELPLRLSS